jgi:type I restriction enzyme S subunit
VKGATAPFIEMAALPLSGRDVDPALVQQRRAKGAGAHFQNGDTLLARITPCLENGKTAQVRGLGPNMVGEGSTEFLVLCGLNPADNDFVYYLCRDPEFRQFAIARMEGTSGRQRVVWQSIAGYPFNPPSAVDRRSAASLLSLLDDRIDNLRATNATLEAIAQALFKSWFVDFDPVHAKAEGRAPAGMDAATAALFPGAFEDSELGPVPKGWRNSTLGAFSESRGGTIQTGPFGSQLHASDYVAGGVPVVMPQDLAGRRIVEDRIARTSPEDAARLARHRLKQGDIVFSRRGDVGRHGVVTARQQGWLCGTGCLLVRPSRDDPPVAFVSGALARPESLDWLERHAVGATMPNLNTKILTALPMVAPPDKLIAAFERIADALGHRVSEDLEQAATLAALRDTLLPRLISGKLRLPEAELAVEEDIA